MCFRFQLPAVFYRHNNAQLFNQSQRVYNCGNKVILPQSFLILLLKQYRVLQEKQRANTQEDLLNWMNIFYFQGDGPITWLISGKLITGIL